jgi:hypothetical protein
VATLKSHRATLKSWIDLKSLDFIIRNLTAKTAWFSNYRKLRYCNFSMWIFPLFHISKTAENFPKKPKNENGNFLRNDLFGTTRWREIQLQNDLFATFSTYTKQHLLTDKTHPKLNSPAFCTTVTHVIHSHNLLPFHTQSFFLSRPPSWTVVSRVISHNLIHSYIFLTHAPTFTLFSPLAERKKSSQRDFLAGKPQKP